MLAKLLLASAFAASAVAQMSTVLFFTRVPSLVTAGQPQAITFSTNDTSTPVSILLREGLSTNLRTVATLTTDAMDGQFIWIPNRSLPSATDYALQIVQGGQTNYYGPITLQGGGQEPSSSSSSTSASSTSSTSSAMIISSNSTRTSSAPPYATGNSTNTNTTMTSATRTSTSMTSSTSAATSSNTGAGFQTSGTAPASATATGAAVIVTASSAMAALFGAVAAILFC